MMEQSDEITHASISSSSTSGVAALRSSIMLFSEQAKARRLRLTLKVLISILSLLLLSGLMFNGFSIPLSSLALGMIVSIVILLFFHFWTSSDTCSVISGMVLWSVAVLISYAGWVGDGIFDSSLLAFPCLLMLAIILSGKLIFISIFIYVISILCFFSVGHNQGLFTGAVLFQDLPLWSRAVSSIIILTFFSAGMFYLFKDIKRRFKYILDKNASLELSISQLSASSRYDQLTRLPNESVCRVDLEKTLLQQKSSGQILAFLTLNISNQDLIKMNYSHDIFDETLMRLAEVLLPYVNNSTVIYRFQQNEFVILKLSKDYQGISWFAEKIHQVCSKKFRISNFDIILQPKIGIALAPFDGTSLEELRHNSHLAMHTKAQVDKEDFSFFDRAMADKEQEKLQLTNSLIHAIDNDEFIVHFQPKINLSTGQIIGAEALVRWISPEHGLIPPTVFIPLAEQVGVITDITQWVTQYSITACKQWHELGFNKLSVAVNLSAEDFKRGNLSTLTLSLLHQVDLPAHFLEFELTESMLMDDIKNIRKQINELRAFGISFSLDDFGTGYSNLGYLTKFNVCTIKLDRSFVMDVCHSSNELQIVKAIIGMSKSLSITNVAEGIEDQETATILTELGCEVGQGYLWSKPLPQKDFIDLLLTSD